MRDYLHAISKDEVEQLPLIQFEGPIHVIREEEEFDAAASEMKQEAVLGFDTETRPSFKKGVVYPTSLIQISTRYKAWILRVGRMGYPASLIEILSDGSILKVGSGLNDDIRRMKSDFNFEPAGFLDLQKYVEAFQIEEKGLKKMAGIVLGHRISKSQQVSNWDAERLSEAQLRYAATDAWVCLEIYNSLRNNGIGK